MARDEFADAQPSMLLTIGDESHHVMSVELESPAGRGGALYEWNLVDGDFSPAFPGIEDWVQAVTTALQDGLGELRDWGDRKIVFLNADAVRRAPGQSAAIVGRDILSWPAHWQRAAGLRAEDIAPRGVTHSISRLLDERPSIVATVRGRVMSLAGWSAETFVRIHDGTAELAVTCPNQVLLLGPVIDGWFEFDVQLVSRQPDSSPAAATEDPALAEFERRHFGSADVVAHAIRRLDPPLS